MVKLLLIFTLFMILAGCKTIKLSDYNVKNSSPILLPNLEPQADMYNLQNVISKGYIQITSDVEYQYIYDLKNVDYNLKIKYFPEQRIYDIIRLFANEVKYNIVDTSSETKGSIQLNLISFKERKNLPLCFFSVWIMGYPCLLGVPFTYYTTKITAQITIYDKNNIEIKKYDGTGKGVAFMAMYWGYGHDTRRKSAIEAFKNVMINIIFQINNDKTELMTKLNEIKN